MGKGIGNSSGGEYQVFLSFRGSDTRRGFTNTLYNALKDAGINVFIDDEELRPGEIIKGNLLRGINDSILYIPIFSPNYASSHWCLRELVKMVENTSKSGKDGNKKVILPIFYGVKPDDVKLKTQLYCDAISNLEQRMEDHEKRFTFEEVETWRHALKEVDSTKGWESEKYPGDGDLAKSIVGEVVNRLQSRHRKVTKDIVGMEDRIAAINKMLDVDSSDVRLIGIYGMGGIGKTTFAKIIFNQLCPCFGKHCSFLDDVRETAKTKGLVKLQEQLLSDISYSRSVHNIGNSDHGISAIGGTICNKKALIVLDDVDDGNQIQELIGMNFLCPGTRIIVTTRDKRVLNIRGFKYEIVPYEMEGLSDQDALQLFCRHAFDDNSPLANYYTLSKDVVSTAGGLPLALQAIGSTLFGREEKNIWKEVLEELRKTPHDDVLGKLRITYDTLKQGQQQIFLDIACFFIHENKTNPIYMWKDCGFSPEYTIDVLINRCMIKVLDNNSFWMHDQFRDLGRAIANQERTRLQARDDIIRELRSTEVNEGVQALHLESQRQTPMTVTAEQIKRFPNLRFLWLEKVTCQGNFTSCLSELRWIDLRDPPHLSTYLHLENVVVIYISGYEWREHAISRLIKGARKLKSLTLEHSYWITRMPDFSKNPVLEKVNFSYCEKLREIDCSIGKLRLLTDLNVECANQLERLPEQIGELKNLQNLSLKRCYELRELPESVSKLESLRKLVASYTRIVKLPGTMGKLSQLHVLDLKDCHDIKDLPKLPGSLTTLKLRSRSLQTVPDLSNLTNLVELLLSDASEGDDKSYLLQPLDLLWIGRQSKLRKLYLCLSNVHATYTEWGSFALLKELTLYRLDLHTLKQLGSNLTILKLGKVQVKQIELNWLPQLEMLTIRYCELVRKLSIPSSLRKLRVAKVYSCPKLVEVEFLGILESMESLHIEDCKSLGRLVCLSEEPGCDELQAPKLTDGWRRVSLISSSLKMLSNLILWKCLELQEIQFVSTLESLKEFSIEGCISLERLGGLSNLKNLAHLSIAKCKRLQLVEGVDELEFLCWLRVWDCRSIERIIDASSSKIPRDCRIWIKWCGELPNSNLNVSPECRGRITWESYRGKILNGPTRASDSKIDLTFSERRTETRDPSLEEEGEGNKDMIKTRWRGLTKKLKRRRFRIYLPGLCGLYSETTMMRRRKVKGQGECNGKEEDEEESDDRETEDEEGDGTG